MKVAELSAAQRGQCRLRDNLRGGEWEASAPLAEFLRADPRSSDSAAKPSQHDADHSETYEGFDGSGVALEVSGQTAEATDPGDSPLNDPSFRQWPDQRPFMLTDVIDLGGKIQSPQRHAEQKPYPGHDTVAV